jgi:hypothetical protein
METSSVTALQAIQAILAPALGISAVGLLLLALNSRYSNIINRIRLLHEEKRKYIKQIVENVEMSFTDNARYISITNQSKELLVRSRYVRNAILLLQLAIALFVLTSVMIGLNLFIAVPLFQSLSLVVFVLGMTMVLVAVGYAAREVYRSYKIVLIEVNADE